jgi:hypothetical protein
MRKPNKINVTCKDLGKGEDDLLVIQVGTDERPAAQEDLESMSNALNKAANERLSIVTHHAVKFVVIKGFRKSPLKAIVVGK